MLFKKEKMIARLEREGRANLIDDEARKIMDNLDGCEANPINWLSITRGEPVVWVKGKDGIGEYANEEDCE